MADKKKNPGSGTAAKADSKVVNSSSATTKPPLELYLVRLSPTCRAVWLYMLQHDIPHILIDVDFSGGEESTPEFISKNPHKEVPILVDGDVVVFECQAIIRYLASTYTNMAGFGLSPPTRMLCESLISWANSELHRVVGYGYTYPQFLDRYRLPTDTANEQLVELAIRQLTGLLERLEHGYLARGRFLTGDRLTVADSVVATVLLQTEWLGFKFKMWPKVEQWMKLVRAQDYWSDVHAAHKQFVVDLENAQYYDY